MSDFVFFRGHAGGSGTGAAAAGHRALAFLGSAIGSALLMLDRARQRRALAGLDARALRDIGVTPGAAAREAAKPFWRA